MTAMPSLTLVHLGIPIYSYFLLIFENPNTETSTIIKEEEGFRFKKHSKYLNHSK